MEPFQIALTITVTTYLGALVLVGALKARAIKTQEDFSLAGRKLSASVLAGTLLATWIGTGSLFGNAEEAYNVGLSALWIPIASTIGIVLLYFLAPRARASKHMTLQDILEDSYGPAARVMGTITLVLAYMIIVSYQYRAGASVVERMFPWIDHTWAIIGMATFVILYTALAGMVSVAYTDCANGILMIVGLLVTLPILYLKTGGASVVIETLGSRANPFSHYSFLNLVSILLPSLLLLLGDANMYTRFFAAENSKAARNATIAMLVGFLLLEVAIILIAIMGNVLVLQGQLDVPTNAGHIIVSLAFDVLPPWLGCLLCATVMAVVISTADSYLLSPASSLTRDVYERFYSKGKANEAKLVKVNRLSVVLLGLVALGLAFTSDKFFSVSLFAYTLYGAGITPVLLAALLGFKVPKWVGVSSMVLGVVVAIAWKFYLKEFSGWESISAVIPAAAASGIFLVVGGLLFRARPNPK